MKLRVAQKAPEPRAYRQTARADAAAAREAQILRCFRNLLEQRWLDEFTLQDVADCAGVTQQTVIRKFGGKEGLLSAVIDQFGHEALARRPARGGAVDQALTELVDDYEVGGDFIMRLLSQEDRLPVLTPFLDVGRRYHRSWAASVFSPWLTPLKPDAREELLDALVCATDLYLWRLLRRDFGHEPAYVLAVTRRLVMGALNGSKLDGSRGGKS